MSSASDFFIDRGTLRKYIGSDVHVVVPNGVREILDDTFCGNKEILSLQFPESLKSVVNFGGSSFSDLKKLQNICVAKENTVFYDVDGVLFENSDKWDHTSQSVIPNGEKHLICYPQGRKHQKYTIPDDTTDIAPGAFYNCKELREITIPDSVTVLRDNAFLGCSNIKHIQANKLVALGNIWGSSKKNEIIKPVICPALSPTKVSNKELKICLAMGYLMSKEIFAKRIASAYEKYIDENRPLILEAAKCHNIETVLLILGEAKASELEIPVPRQLSVAEAKQLFMMTRKASGIKIEAYLGKDKIVDIPYAIGKTDVMLFGTDAFDPDTIIRCSAKLFTKLQIANQAASYLAYKTGAVIFTEAQAFEMKRSISQKTEEFAIYALEHDDVKLLAVVLDDASIMTEETFLRIRSHMKENAQINAVLLAYQNKMFDPQDLETKRSSIELKAAGLEERTLSDWKKVFSLGKQPNGYVIQKYRCNEADVQIPAAIDGIPVVNIADFAFSSNNKITNVTIPDCVLNIGKSAFSKCRNLKTVILGNGIRRINRELFCECNALEHIVIPNTVQKIETCAFWKCQNLRSVTIPRSVTLIYPDAFSFCVNLTISGAIGSYAETYAKENNIPFVAE